MADERQVIGEGPSQALGTAWDNGAANFFQERESALQKSEPVDLGRQFEAISAAPPAIENALLTSPGTGGGGGGGEA